MEAEAASITYEMLPSVFSQSLKNLETQVLLFESIFAILKY